MLLMPCKGVRDAKSDSKGCLLYPYNRHPLLRNKASLTVVQGIRTSVSRHRYKRSPCFAKSGWQNDGSHSENGHGHSCDHVTARVKIKMFCKQYSEKRTPLKYICTRLIFSTLQIFEKRLRKVGESSKESQSFMPINSQKDGMFLRESYNVLQVVNIFRFATNLCGHMVTAVTVTVSV